MTHTSLQVAYFTMEIGIKTEMPTYAGGLGMLAGDLMLACRDLKTAAVCVTMRWQHGYMKQSIQKDGKQTYSNYEWSPEEFLTKLPQTVSVTLEGREVHIAVWQYDLTKDGHTVPVLFLDTDLPENDEQDRAITRYLYGGDGFARLKQEAVLGIGGVRMLQALGYDVKTYHMNEGHAAFLTLELLKQRDWQDNNVKPSCAFTTHTPVKAGHDAFSYDDAHKVLGDALPWHIRDLAGQDSLSMTHLAMHLSRYTCGVSQIHGQVSRDMFPGEEIDAITNGVHHLRWACPSIQEVFDRYCDGWRSDPFVLQRTAHELPDDALWHAHQSAKHRLIDEVNRQTGQHFDVNHLTIASARRVVSYKRPELIYTNLMRLKEICCGKVQIIHAGNAHPSDPFAQSVIERMVQRSAELRDFVKIAYLENYNPTLASYMVSGADVWLNTPMRLHEASGTSGMKACLNGVLNLSTLDGWWIEGYERDPESGWRIGPLAKALPAEEHRKVDAEDLYTQLQYEVIPEYYNKDRSVWINRMKRAISLLGFFSAQRCVQEYMERAW